MKVTDQDFENLSKLISAKCGIVLKAEKKYLIHQRIEPIVSSSGCKSFAEFYIKVRNGNNKELQDDLIAAITTNETSFFRDKHPFESFKDYVLPKLVGLIKERKNRMYSRKGAKVRIWSAASSTGQEPYCISILIHEYVTNNKNNDILLEDFEIIATDISSKVLSKAIAGEFTDIEIMRGLTSSKRDKYFIKHENKWLLNENLRNMVEFRRVNLIEPFTMLGGFDVIFCRNVLIYFDETTKRRIFDQFYEMLSDQGFLILGASESTYGLTELFKSVRYNGTILYIKNM